ncbi:nuclear transport factor 2 family protein [Ramlibacter albus]|uniref:Nuclear transport factor 2 family protein n=1 Tax=Ramlibacter albus TaxID=2079448 RepID=A0A923MD71_9BURK|nr:nuclear transport factor 2 family protein [Ramlibacter albus]MBC5767278.1 nuclear transport factor 2 family protein [Ramlibacter albus]
MEDATKTLQELERKFWQSMVDEQTDTALGLLDEPALMVSAHGSMKFGHDEYRKMAEHGQLVLKRYELGDIEAVFPTEDTAILMYSVTQTTAPRESSKGGEKTEEMVDTSTWVRKGGTWKCVMHTETPAAKGAHARG